LCCFPLQLSPSVLWCCWLGLLTCKNRLPYNLYCVGGDIKHCTIQSITGAVVREQTSIALSIIGQNSRDSGISVLYTVYSGVVGYQSLIPLSGLAYTEKWLRKYSWYQFDRHIRVDVVLCSWFHSFTLIFSNRVHIKTWARTGTEPIVAEITKFRDQQKPQKDQKAFIHCS